VFSSSEPLRVPFEGKTGDVVKFLHVEGQIHDRNVWSLCVTDYFI